MKARNGTGLRKVIPSVGERIEQVRRRVGT